MEFVQMSLQVPLQRNHWPSSESTLYALLWQLPGRFLFDINMRLKDPKPGVQFYNGC